MKANIKALIMKYRGLFVFLAKVYNYIQPKNRIRMTRCKLKMGITKINGLKIECKGKNNVVYFGDVCRIKNCRIVICGNNNVIHIGSHTIMDRAELWVDDDNNEIRFADKSFCVKGTFSVMEGTKIVSGTDCMFAYGCVFRTGDSHSILDMEGNRINPSKDIVIGNHVWFGTQVTALKGTVVPDDCIIAANCTLNKPFDESHCIIGGLPGKVIKRDVTWRGEKI